MSLSQWQPPARPQWLQRLNAEAASFDLKNVVPLDKNSLISAACSATGLTQFGDDFWREPFEVLIKSIETDAELNLMGRLMSRNDILTWLKNRLQITDLLKRHPEILEQEIASPMFIVGLPRSGTSILFELLSQDPRFGVPLLWEAMIPCPPPESANYNSDARIDYVDRVVTQWARAVPEFATMHEMGGRIPAECGLIMANTFLSDHIASLHQATDYSLYYAQADLTPVYEYHKVILQILQWKNPRRCWLLKAPEHQNNLEILLKVYPDARVVQTHRDPIKSMASATSLLGSLYWIRSDKAFDASSFEDITMGAATAARLESVIDQRQNNIVPEANITDSRYQDLMDDPLQCIRGIYSHFDMSLDKGAAINMEQYLNNKPKGKHGAHSYSIDAEEATKDWKLFERYRRHYNIPSEV
jgi:hypothetical protein